MNQTVFNSKGTAVLQKCIDCAVTLDNYAMWDGSEGPLCWLCWSKREEKGVDILDKNVKELK